ncbi:MAG: NUDIX hydrolase [Acidimicrobiaceae bacterium]|nr:NUDIX hydrolase [Acidimicrobiaceae bacterium]
MFNQIAEVELYRSNVISLVKTLFTSPDGKTFDRDVVRHVGAVSIVPLLQNRKQVILLSQFRASIGKPLFEVPAGKRDVAEEPQELTAVRELEEELGLKCSTLIKLGEFDNSPGFTDEHSYSYMACGLSLGKIAPQSVEEAQSSIVVTDLGKVPQLISMGIITDAKTIIGLARVSHYLECETQCRSELYPISWSSSDAGGDSPLDTDEVTTWSRTLPIL